MAAARALMMVEKNLPKKMLPMWNHPAGLQTIHFWAPAFKWGLVFAGISDLYRPASKLSFSQSLSLGCTGALWSRFSMVIVPKNYNLFSVNVFLCAVGFTQVARVLNWRKEQEAEGKELPPLI